MVGLLSRRRKAMSLQNRRGLTKVEWLALFACIGIVMMLLFPAIDTGGIRTARRNQCATQINNLSKAALMHDILKGHLPGYLNDFGSYVGDSDPAEDPNAGFSYRSGDKKVGGWVIPLLPYLDAQPTYEIWTMQRYPLFASKNGQTTYTSHAAPNLVCLQCPSSPTLAGDLGRNSYIANTGMHHLTASGQPIAIVRAKTDDADVTSYTVTFADSMQVAGGAMNHQYAGATDAIDYPVGPRVKLEDFKDGMGNTALFSESLHAIPWHQLDPDPMVSIRMLQPVVPGEQVAYPKLSRFVHGMVWLYEDPEGAGGAPQPPAYRTQVINSSPDAQDIYSIKMNRDNAVELARPSSAHSEGCHFGFADGSSRFISETIDYRVYQALLTPHGKKSIVPDPSYVLVGEAL